MKELETVIKEIASLSKIDYHQLLKKYPKELVDKYLDKKLLDELSLSKSIEDKINLWDNYGYYLSTKEHSIYEQYELLSIVEDDNQNKNCLSRQQELIYGLHLLSKHHLTITIEKGNEINLDIQKVLASIKTKETRDYILNKLTNYLNTTSISSNNNKFVLSSIQKYIILCKSEEIPNIDNLFNDKVEIIDEQELKEQIDMYIRYCNAKEIFLLKNLDLVEYAVSNCYKFDQDYKDTFQDGTIALINAISKFDVRMKNKFSSYAVPAIIRHITRERPKYSYGISLSYDLHELKRKVKQSLIILTSNLQRYPTITELADYLEISEEKLNKRLYLFYLTGCRSVNEVIELEGLEPFSISDTIVDKSINIEQEIIDKDMQEEIFKSIEETLTPSEMDLLFKIFGLNTKGNKPMTLSEIGKMQNITKEAVRKRKVKALEKVNKKLNAKYY